MLDTFIKSAKTLGAISHPKRLEIINLLRGRSLSVCEIFSMLGLPQANLSQHLSILRQNKIVTTKKAGKQIIYSLSNPHFLKAADLIREAITNEPIKNFPSVTDPVCGMEISPTSSTHSLRHHGRILYFCASGCYQQFINNNQKI